MVVFGLLHAIKTSQDPFDFVEDVPKSIPIPGGDLFLEKVDCLVKAIMGPEPDLYDI